MAKITASRFHDISCGHRVVGHEGKCRHLHGHNYRIHFHCQSNDGDLDDIGRVIDFGVIKQKLCMWLEENWDHKFLAWEEDTLLQAAYYSIHDILGYYSIQNTLGSEDAYHFQESMVFVPFNPTAENMAQYLVDYIGPKQLEGTSVTLTSVVIEETAKCSVTYNKRGFE